MNRWCLAAACTTILAACSANVGPLPCGDDAHCGTGQVCAAGKCVDPQACAAGQVVCADGPQIHACYDLQTSTAHCGSCDKACAPPANAAAVCSAGQCSFTCAGVTVRTEDGTQCRLNHPIVSSATPVSDVEIDVSWAKVAGADSYELTRDDGTTQVTKQVSGAGAGPFSFQDTGLSPNTAYRYTLVADAGADLSLKSPRSPPVNAATLLSAPGNVTVTSPGPTTARITWDAVPGATSYTLLRADGADNAASYVAKQTGLTGSVATDGDHVLEGAIYYYKIQAYKAGVAGALAAAGARVVTGFDGPVLTPTMSGDGLSVQLSWTQVPNATGYVLQRATDLLFTQNVVSIATIGTNLGATDSAIQPGVQYWYQVAASSTATPVGTYSAAQMIITTLFPPGAPAITGKTTGSVSLSWTKSPGAETYATYTIQRQANGAGPFNPLTALGLPAGATAYTDGTALAGTPYVYRIVAHTSAPATSAPADIPTTTPIATPATPVVGNNDSTDNTTRLDISWTLVSGQTQTLIEQSSDNGATWHALPIVPNSATSYVDSVLTPGSVYQYRITAISAAAVRSPAPSAPASGITQLSMPVIGAINGVAPGGLATVVLGWAQVPGFNVKYHVNRALVKNQGSGPPLSFDPPQLVADTAPNLANPSYSDTSAALLPGTTYVYQIVAFNSSIASLASVVKPVTISIDAPTNLGLDASTAGMVNVRWTATANAPGSTHYAVGRCPTATSDCTLDSNYSTLTSTVAGTQYSDSLVAGATRYGYAVIALTPAATSPSLKGQNALTGLVTPEPISSPAASANGVTIDWPQIPGADLYQVSRANQLTDGGTALAGSGYFDAGVCASGTCEGVDDGGGLTPFNTYYYQVQAFGHPPAPDNGTTVQSGISAQLGVLTAIAPPTNVVAVATRPTQVSITWSSSAPHTQFVVYRSSSAAGPWDNTTRLGNTIDQSPFTTGGTSWLDSGLQSGQIWYYAVASSNSYLTSTASVVGPVTLPAAQVGAVTALTAGVSTLTPSQVDLGWQGPPGTGITYNIYRSDDQGSNYFPVASGITALSYSDTLVPTGNQEQYRVESQQVIGGTTNYGPAVSVTTFTPYLPPPSGFTGSAASGSITLSWNSVNGANGYNVYASLDGRSANSWVLQAPARNPPGFGVGTTTNTTSYMLSSVWTGTYAGNVNGYATQSTLQGGTPYYFMVTSAITDGQGNAVESNNFSQVARVVPPLATPTIDPIGGATTGDVTLFVSNVPGAVGYVVQRSPDGIGWANIGGVAGHIPTATQRPWTDYTLTSPGSYYYRAAAWSPTSQSPFSTSVNTSVTNSSAGTQASAPTVQGAPQAGLVTIVWNALGTGVTVQGYNVLRSTDLATWTVLGSPAQSVTNFLDTQALAGTTYYYKIQGLGTGPTAGAPAFPSPTLQVDVPVAPPVQINGAGGVNGGVAQVALSWTPSIGASGYRVFRASGRPPTTADLKIADGPNTSAADLMVSSGVQYQYAVQAYAGTVASALTATPAVVTPDQNSIIGSCFLNYVTMHSGTLADATSPTACDLSQATLQGLVLSGGQYTVQQGIGTADGYFAVANVPQGAQYLLRYNSDYRPAARHVDLGQDFLGRPDVQKATLEPTNLLFNLGNIAAYQPTDIFETFSANTGQNFFKFNNGGTGTPQQPGATALANVYADLTQNFAPQLIAPGDDLTIYQLATQLPIDNVTHGPVPVAAMARFNSFTWNVAAQVDGQDTSISQQLGGSFTSSPQVTIRWPRSQWADASPPATGKPLGGYLYQVSPAAIPQPFSGNSQLCVDPAPLGNLHGLFSGSGTPDVLCTVAPPVWRQADLNLPAVTFGNPFPSNWPLFAAGGVDFMIPLMIPGATNLPTPGFGIPLFDTLGAVQAQMGSGAGLVPLLSPVRNVTINGAAARSRMSGVGASPTISWQPPANGAPSYYQLTFTRVRRTQNANGTFTAQRAERNYAKLVTTDTSVVVPPGILQPGANYYYLVNVGAVLEPTTDPLGHPFRGTLTSFVAPNISGVFTP